MAALAKWSIQMNQPIKTPLALFDTLQNIDNEIEYDYLSDNYCLNDTKQAIKFLKLYTGSQGTFNSYRREIERLIHWSALIENKSISDITHHDLQNFISFCISPPKQWIGTTKPARFINKEGKRVPNLKWRPFVATISKAKHKDGVQVELSDYHLGNGSIREIFAILGSFYSYLVQEEYALSNPVARMKQKSKFISSSQTGHKIRRLSELQWQYVISKATQLADLNPDLYERTLFIMSALYSMYLRISELAASERHQPTMNDFQRDNQENWWFTTIGKGNKERQIAVSDSMLQALRRWREHLGLSSLPTPADQSPLLAKAKGQGAIKSVNYIRQVVQDCFDRATEELERDGFNDDAEALKEATVHWLRHTGISDDVKIRPREHVRDDAGHSSGAITDHYIDIELHERHYSAKKKLINED